MQFWTAFEVGQLYVPNALVQISSIMPQKRNPVPIEHLRHLASMTVGRCDAIVNTMHNTPFTDMNDSEGEVQVAGYAAFESGGRVLALLTALIPACRVRADRVAANMDAACVTITELADTLVRVEGLSFRQAHEIASHTARAVIRAGQPLGAGHAAFAEAFRAETGRAPALDGAAYADAVSPAQFVASRTRFGGPAPAPMEAALAGYAATLDTLRAACAARIARIEKAEGARDAAFARLTEE
jgi:argininosuccinate lyase